MNHHFISHIISGGQTGVDRAALDVAKKLGISYGGWCPRGRWAEDASIPNDYHNMKETPSFEPEQRTDWNVRDSDGTLIITKGMLMGGTLHTIHMAEKYEKPYLIFDLTKNHMIEDVVLWK